MAKEEIRPSEGTLTKEFQVVSGKVRVTDPCYDTNVWCSAEVQKVKNGKWNAFVIKSEEGDWGFRCAVLQVWHSDFRSEDVINDEMEHIDADIGVDSGQAGVFDSKFYNDDKSVDGVERMRDTVLCKDKPFYSMCCDRSGSDEQWGTIPYGAVSSSGFGDGGYDAFKTIRDGKVVAIKIVFISDDHSE